jgi:hypothetical protein
LKDESGHFFDQLKLSRNAVFKDHVKLLMSPKNLTVNLI